MAHPLIPLTPSSPGVLNCRTPCYLPRQTSYFEKIRELITHPVYRGLIMLQIVVDCDAESIAPGCINGWAWVLSVDEEADFVAASSVVACAIGNV